MISVSSDHIRRVEFKNPIERINKLSTWLIKDWKERQIYTCEMKIWITHVVLIQD